MDKEEWERTLPKASKALYEATLKMGGKITAEHGIGLTRKKLPEDGLYGDAD